LDINPGFKAAGKASLTDPDKLPTFINYNIPVNSPLHTKGVALRSFGIIPGDKDFNQHLTRTNGIGACF
jgi:hypothetical protein